MEMSIAAKAAWPLLWTECDDQGVFEWKPVVLKARLLPADNIDFGDVLAEYLRLGAVVTYQIDGKSYGAVRNFQRFQRPKKPNKVHPIPEDFRKFVGITPSSSVPVPNQDGTGPGKSPQMKDEGGRREDEGGKEDNDVVVTPPSTSGTHAFEANFIRLTDSDLAKWRQAFPHLGLEAELWALDEWAGSKGKKWFVAVSGALAKKEREAVDRASAAKANREAGGGAPARREGRI